MLGDQSPVLQHRDKYSSACFCRFGTGPEHPCQQVSASVSKKHQASLQREDGALNSLVLPSSQPFTHHTSECCGRPLRPAAQEKDISTPDKITPGATNSPKNNPPSHPVHMPALTYQTVTRRKSHQPRPARQTALHPICTHARIDLRLFKKIFCERLLRASDQVDYDYCILCDHCILLMSCKWTNN